MKVLLNALSARRGGGQTYLSYLLREIPNNIDKVYVLASKTFAVPWNEKITIIATPDWTENPILRAAWETFYIPYLIFKNKIDVVFCPGGTIPAYIPKNCKSVVVFQNMLPFWKGIKEGYPSFLARSRLRILKYLFLNSMRRADLVIFISNYAKNFILNEMNLPVKKFVVIPHGLDDQFKTYDKDDVPWPERIPCGARYLLYVSIMEPYKHQVEVVRAFKLLKDNVENKELSLVLVGINSTPYGHKVKNEIKESFLENNIILLGNVAHSELPKLYRHAAVNIFASSCENCPNVLLEKIGSGRPLACSIEGPSYEFAAVFDSSFFTIGSDKIKDAIINCLNSTKLNTLPAHKNTEKLKHTDTVETWSVMLHL